MTDDPITRRRLLRGLVVLSGAAVLRTAAGAATRQTATWVPIGPVSRFPPGKVTHVVLPDAFDGEEIYVTADAHGEYRVFSARCTHKGCLVDWHDREEQFVCPCHAGRFAADGSNIGGPPMQPLQLLAAQVDDNGIVSIRIT